MIRYSSAGTVMRSLLSWLRSSRAVAGNPATAQAAQERLLADRIVTLVTRSWSWSRRSCAA